MKKLFISSLIPDGIKDRLIKKYDLRLLPPDDRLDKPVSAHADMLCGRLDDVVILNKEYYEKNAALFDQAPVVITEKAISKEYPRDIILNFIDTKNAVIGHKDVISVYAGMTGKKPLPVRQGYARCSTLIFGNCAVSADGGILSALQKEGFKTLLIKPGGIELPGYGCGFIGGASFLDGDTVYFFGRTDCHPQYELINGFIAENGYKTVELSQSPLTDYGGAVVI